MLDDLGFAQLGCYGSDIATPAIDGLAAGGLRYRRFHVTAMCSPTRACLLTGRNQHRVGMGFVADLPIGFPGYDGRIPRTAAGMPRLLRDAGYNTFAVGKWHLAPRWEQSASGPFDHWPLGLGFERYYGFLNGDTNQWAPDLVADNGFVEPPRTPEEGYHLTEDLADRAIRFIQDQQQATPGKPFFCYLATGAVHAPHQAPASYIDAYRGQFDDGWEAWRERTFARQVAAGVVPEGTTLGERPPWVPDWARLSPDERRLYARFMEVFAGFVTHTDAQIGRVLDFLRATDLLDDTLVLLISDNGTSGEGGPTGSFNEHRFTHDRVDDVADTLARIDDLGGFRAYNHYPWGWAWAGQHAAAPVEALRLAGRGAHAADRALARRDRRGRRGPGPRPVRPRRRPAAHGARRGRAWRRRRWSTASASCRSTAPACGRRSRPTAPTPRAPGRPSTSRSSGRARSSTTGGRRPPTTSGTRSPSSASRCRAATTSPPTTGPCSTSTTTSPRPTTSPPSTPSGWPSSRRCGGTRPAATRCCRSTTAWSAGPWPWSATRGPPGPRRVYRPGGGGIAEDFLPAMGGGFRLVAEVEVPEGGGDGVICALGDWSNGWAWYVLDGRPTVAFSLFGAPCRVAADARAGGRRPHAGGGLRAGGRRRGRR